MGIVSLAQIICKITFPNSEKDTINLKMHEPDMDSCKKMCQ